MVSQIETTIGNGITDETTEDHVTKEGHVTIGDLVTTEVPAGTTTEIHAIGTTEIAATVMIGVHEVGTTEVIAMTEVPVIGMIEVIATTEVPGMTMMMDGVVVEEDAEVDVTEMTAHHQVPLMAMAHPLKRVELQDQRRTARLEWEQEVLLR